MGNVATARVRGFTIVEAAISAIVLGMLAAATLTSVSAAAAGRRNSADRSAGRMLAEDLIGEIGGLAYTDPENEAAAPGPDASEVNGASRVLFDDVDDYHGLKESPPTEVDGKVIAGLTGWKRETTVEWVSLASPKTGAGAETSIKRITVNVYRGTRLVGRAQGLRTGAWHKAVRADRAIGAVATEAFVTPK